MGDHVNADLDQITWLAGQVDTAATTMTDGQADALTTAALLGGDAVPIAAFGNTTGGPACHASWKGVEGGALAAYANLNGMLTADVGRLGEVVACFGRMDLESADQVCASANGLNVFTTHVHSEGADERGDANDRARAGQINMAIDHVVNHPGSTVFTGDLNETRGSHTDSGDTISELVTQHGYTDAGRAAGGTSSGGNRIDFVFTSPSVRPGGPADRVEGHPSDHDGIAVDMTVAPDW